MQAAFKSWFAGLLGAVGRRRRRTAICKVQSGNLQASIRIRPLQLSASGRATHVSILANDTFTQPYGPVEATYKLHVPDI